MRPTLLARIDTRVESGLGHLYRSLAILECAQQDNWDVYVFGEAIERFASGVLKDYTCISVPMNETATQDALLCQQLFQQSVEAEQEQPSVVWIDHYDFQQYWESAWPSEVIVAAIDDLKRDHEQNTMIVDPSPFFEQSHYAQHKFEELLLGTKYLLFRREFRAQALAVTEPDATILVSFGGADVNQYGLKALLSLHECREIVGSITWVAGDQRQLRFWTRTDLIVHVIPQANNMVELYRSHSIALGAAGVGMWERLSQKLFSVTWQIAENQTDNARYAAKSSLVEFVNLPPDVDSESWISVVQNRLAGPNVSKAVHSEIDSIGCNRVWSAILRHSKMSIALEFQTYRTETFGQLLALQSIPGMRDYSRNAAIPSSEEHQRWSMNLLNRDLDNGWLVYRLDNVVGWLRLTKAEDDYWEISFLVNPEFQGLGIGAKILAYAKNQVSQLKGYVMSDNNASNSVFKRSGFEEKNNWYYWSKLD